MIRVFIYVLAVLAMLVVSILPLAGALILINRHTHHRAWFWAWLATLPVYMAATVAVIHVVTSELADWLWAP